MAPGSAAGRGAQGGEEVAARQRILTAAFETFVEKGYAGSSTIAIATRARVSKRELYALVGNKHEMLVACISDRAKRLAAPFDLPDPCDRESLARVLAGLGQRLLGGLSDPDVIAVFRLAIAEAIRTPQIAHALNAIGGEASRGAVREMMTGARSSGLLRGDPLEMAEHFTALLWRNLMLGLLLGVAKRPGPREIARRAQEATASFLQLHSSSNQGSEISPVAGG